MESLAKLKEIADRNNVSYETLCEYALQAASASQADSSAAGTPQQETKADTQQEERKE